MIREYRPVPLNPPTSLAFLTLNLVVFPHLTHELAHTSYNKLPRVHFIQAVPCLFILDCQKRHWPNFSNHKQETEFPPRILEVSWGTVYVPLTYYLDSGTR